MITTQILSIERKVECGRSDDSDLLRRRRQHARASCAYSVKRMYGIDKGVDCAATSLTTHAGRHGLAPPSRALGARRPQTPHAASWPAASAALAQQRWQRSHPRNHHSFPRLRCPECLACGRRARLCKARAMSATDMKRRRCTRRRRTANNVVPDRRQRSAVPSDELRVPILVRAHGVAPVVNATHRSIDGDANVPSG